MIHDNSGNIWIGFRSAGNSACVALAKYSTSTSLWTYYNQINTPSLPSNSVTALAHDNAGNIWIGTNVGLVKFNGLNFTTYTTDNGLSANSITSIDCANTMVYI